MKRVILSLLLSVAAVVSAGNTIAQEEATANIARVVEVRAIAGHEAQFEAGVKEHIAWAAENGYGWSWNAWEVITGEGTGDYLVATFNHSWADFDNPPIDMAANEASIAEHISPHVERADVSFWSLRAEVSNPDPSGIQAAMSSVTSYVVKAGKGGDVNHAMSAFHEVVAEHQPDLYYYVFDLVSGGPQGAMLISAPVQSFASLGDDRGNFLQDALGEFAARDLGERFNGSMVSAETSMLAYRADLSFAPE